MHNSSALITGASAGIGQEFAIQIAKTLDFDLVLVARRESRLIELKQKIELIWEKENRSRNVYVLPCDLSRDEKRESLFNKIDKLDIKIELLINNAGFGSVGKITELPENREQDMIALNCKALAHLANHFARKMKQQKNGSIINVSSTASFQPMPYMATYAATKAFVTSFSIALSGELKEHGISVLALCPGPTESEFHIAAGLEKKMSHVPAMSATRVVKEALRAADKGKNLHITGFGNLLMTFLPRILGLKISSKVVKSILKTNV